MDEIDRARDGGYTFHSAKVGAEVETDIERIRFLDSRMEPGEEITFDVNRAWLPAEAIAVLNATRDVNRVVEQPCETLEQHLRVRRLVAQPLAIDESLQSLGDVLRIVETDACEVVGLKIGRVGGLTVARRIRDICLQTGIRMNIEDTGGTRLQATAVVHLAQATPEPFRRATWLCFDHLTHDPIGSGVSNDGGWAVAPDRPGIGVEPDPSALGEPVAVHHCED
jgi:L-alanine-DL-glutamate epimerase-like enolase superfamily enzyme